MIKKKRKRIIKYSKNRAVFSDTLPYEIPLTFSNRHFYNFLNNYNVVFYNKFSGNEDEQTIKWAKNKDDKVVELLLKLLFDLNNLSVNNGISFQDKEFGKIPFTYKIAHKEKDFRDLTIPHPKSQIELVSFYEEYKELILYYSGKSPFSIRKPSTVAKFVFADDWVHKKKKGDELDIVEENNKEYESLKTYFTYKKYSNIYKFYEDYRYHRAEKKYDKMYKFDISRCFDSIYTHSLVWALYNKELVKDQLIPSRRTFAGRFDLFMQHVNFNETNGIIIGPEFSRIFAELILQYIDVYVEAELRKKKLIFQRDYEIYRYIDDYFVFFNDEKTLDEILTHFKLKLKEYKMSVSESKKHLYTKPLITELSIAKNKIVDLLNEEVKCIIEKKEEKEKEKEKESITNYRITFKCNSNKLITKFKIIISESKVEYKDIMNYTLAMISRNVERSISKYEKYSEDLIKESLKISNGLPKDDFLDKDYQARLKNEQNFTMYLIELLDFTFFIYTVNPRVNYTIKLCHILSSIIASYNTKVRYFTGEYEERGNKKIKKYDKPESRYLSMNKELIFKKISDEICLVLEKNKMQEHVQIETLYLLIALRELGGEFQLSKEKIISYFKLKEISDLKNTKGKHSKKYEFSYFPNYFVITTMLFYIRDIHEYQGIKCILKNAITKKIKEVEKKYRAKNTELVLLFFDLLVCPYLDNKFKRRIFTMYGIDNTMHDNIIQFKKKQKYWFTKWENFNFTKEIEAKIAQEPY